LLVIFVGLISAQAYGDGFNPPVEGDWHLAGPAIVGTITLGQTGSEGCTTAGQLVYINFLGNCKGDIVRYEIQEHKIVKCLSALTEEDIEGLQIDDYLSFGTGWENCQTQDGPKPLIINTLTFFDKSTITVQADAVLLFRVEK
jgi:hypothetical protein